MIDLTGLTFGKLTVIAIHANRSADGHVKFECVCECGLKTIAFGKHLRSGHTVSCGCFRSEWTIENKTTHGATSGEKFWPEYDVWAAMKQRCQNTENKDYKHYGGRGISVCERWSNDFSAFIADMGRRPSAEHSIDRVNNNGNYEPGNCRWVMQREQVGNRRKITPRRHRYVGPLMHDGRFISRHVF